MAEQRDGQRIRAQRPPMAVLVDAASDATIASEVEIAATRTARRRGLLGRSGLDVAAALVLTPCRAIHTVGMKFPIDVMFVDRVGCVRKIASAVAPWRIVIAPGAYAAIEMASGSVAARGVALGDVVAIRFADGTVPSPGDLPDRSSARPRPLADTP